MDTKNCTAETISINIQRQGEDTCIMSGRSHKPRKQKAMTTVNSKDQLLKDLKKLSKKGELAKLFREDKKKSSIFTSAYVNTTDGGEILTQRSNNKRTGTLFAHQTGGAKANNS